MPGRKERQEPAGAAPFYRSPAGDPYRMVCDPNGSHHRDVWYVATTWPHTSLTVSYHPHIITTLHHPLPGRKGGEDYLGAEQTSTSDNPAATDNYRRRRRLLFLGVVGTRRLDGASATVCAARVGRRPVLIPIGIDTLPC